jgi:hypothetical protein
MVDFAIRLSHITLRLTRQAINAKILHISKTSNKEKLPIVRRASPVGVQALVLPDSF